MVSFKPLSAVMNHPACYRLWQQPFVQAKFAPIRRHNRLSQTRRVLDVGCGPGTNAPFFTDQDYLGLDHNPRYIETARQRYRGRFLVADACSFAAPAGEKFDLILLNSLLHHIDTTGVRRLLSRLPELLDSEGHVHILDLVLPERPSAARLLAKSDRGDYPRPWQEWRDLFQESFQEVVCEPYTVGCCGLTLWNMIYFKGRGLT